MRRFETKIWDYSEDKYQNLPIRCVAKIKKLMPLEKRVAIIKNFLYDSDIVYRLKKLELPNQQIIKKPMGGRAFEKQYRFKNEYD